MRKCSIRRIFTFASSKGSANGRQLSSSKINTTVYPSKSVPITQVHSSSMYIKKSIEQNPIATSVHEVRQPCFIPDLRDNEWADVHK